MSSAPDVSLPGNCEDCSGSSLELEIDEPSLPDDAEDMPGSETEMPPDALDDADWCDVDAHLLAEFEQSVPRASTPGHLDTVPSGRHDVAELYSPPRLVPACVAKGLTGSLSMDILTGWNFDFSEHTRRSLDLLQRMAVLFVMVSPPCTMFSVLQALWNFKRMDPGTVEMRLSQARNYISHAMECCLQQYTGGRFFCFEHPYNSTAWTLPCVRDLWGRPNVHAIIFDQCMCGLVSKVDKVPMRKRTRLLTNSRHVLQAFSNCRCNGSHAHRIIEGEEGGMKRAAWAQIYPPNMVERLATAVDSMSRGVSTS